MKKRKLTGNAPWTERALLAACSTLWFGCKVAEEPVALYGCPPPGCEEDSSSSTTPDENSSSSIALSSSSSMDIGPQPLYGVFYSSSELSSSSMDNPIAEYGVPMPESSSSEAVSSSETLSSSSLAIPVALYGIMPPIEDLSSSEPVNSSSSSSLDIVAPVYGVPSIPPNQP